MSLDIQDIDIHSNIIQHSSIIFVLDLNPKIEYKNKYETNTPLCFNLLVYLFLGGIPDLVKKFSCSASFQNTIYIVHHVTYPSHSRLRHWSSSNFIHHIVLDSSTEYLLSVYNHISVTLAFLLKFRILKWNMVFFLGKNP